MFDCFRGTDGNDVYLSALQVRAIRQSARSSDLNKELEAAGKERKCWSDVIVGPESVTVTVEGAPRHVASCLNAALVELRRNNLHSH